MERSLSNRAKSESRRGIVPKDFIVPMLFAIGLAILSQVHFLWFHTLAEFFAIVVGVSLYLIAHYSHVFNRNGFLLFLSQGFFWAACVDLIHTFAYAGMGLIENNEPNSATQLWLLARALEAWALLIAPRYLDERQPPRWSFAAFGACAGTGIALTFAGLLPAAYVAGQGLTPFKIAAENAIITLLAGASVYLYLRRKLMDDDLYRIMLGILALTMLSEFAFTFYVGVHDVSNLVGHIFKFWAFWLLLLAITRWMLAQPFRMLSRNAHSFDHIPLPVLLVSPDGIIQSGNAAARASHPAGGAGLGLHATWHPASLPAADCPVCCSLADGRACEVEVRDPDQGRWAAIHLKPIRQEGGTPGFVYVHNDITEMRHTRERLMQAEKMEAIGQLSGGLAHDFNNLLGIVLGSLNLLSPRIAGDEKARRHLELALNGARRAADVTRSLLAVARKQSLEPRLIPVVETLAEALPLLQQSAGQSIEISVTPCPDLQIRVDPVGLGSALLNLVINARDAMPSGGRIRIEAQALAVGPSPSEMLPCLPAGNYVVISVSDNGAGMAPEVVAHAFEPFYTTKEKGRGTGLGLAMVHGFAHQSGGTATIYSLPEAGTTVRLYLPAVPIETMPELSTAPTPPHGHGECILVVDDEEGLLAIAGEWLTALGYHVIRTAQPRRALELLATHRCDALFTDIAIPGDLDGPALVHEAQARHPELRILFASGYAGETRLGDYPLLQKPYSQTELARAIHTLFQSPPNTDAPLPEVAK
jgi:signal transduction histidine kinase